MERNILLENYLKSLEQKYNAVCFDIDGTLTTRDTKNIDDRAIDMIIDLLVRKIPVVFITGRGETGLEDLKRDIYLRIKTSESITDSDMKRIYVLTNDGARLFYSNVISQEEFLGENVYITTEEELNQLLIVDKMIKEIKNKLENNDYFRITYSKDLKTNQILNVRMVFNTHDDGIINSMFDNIDKYIINNGLNGIHLTRGMYTDNPVIQIGTATKDKAIKRTEKIIGVPQNSMIRIGDCGDSRGNDYAMLNCNQGYSVDKTSGSNDSCFPIFDDYGNVLKGVEATLKLVKSAKILPTVSLEKADKDTYKYNLAKVESNIVSGRQSLLKKYNNLISSNFNNCNGIDDLFDKESGSIIIPMYEMELLQNSPLKDFWISSENGSLIYSLRDNNNYLLRGSKTYYYFISNRISINRKDITSKEDVISWYKNNEKFLNDSINVILSTENLNNQINKKLLLGVLDNCRNILLVLINHCLVSNYFDKNILFDISLEGENRNNKLYNTIMEIERLMSGICFESQYIVDKEKTIEIINNTRKVLLNNMIQELEKDDEKDYSKNYRAYREIDNFAENYIAVSLYKEKCDNNRFANACGLSYGGIELPILAKIVDQNRIEKLLILKFNKEVSGYKNKQLLDLRKFNIKNFNGLKNSEFFENSNVDLFDDNILTGKTLQIAINALYDCNINVNNICIVRYPSINRIDQMFLDNPSAVDYNLFFNYIYGLCFSSPYSWKDNNWKNEKGETDYTDSLGVFDLNRKKIVECLIKNHDYKEESEVGEYRRSFIK